MNKKKHSIALSLVAILFFTVSCNFQDNSPFDTDTDTDDPYNTTDGDTYNADADLPTVSFVVTDTMQTNYYDNDGNVIDAPSENEDYYGQDAQYDGITPSYTDNDDYTITDNNTGLMWLQYPAINKMTYDEAVDYVESLTTGGYDDWRLPTIKESFSLAMMAGHLDCDSNGDAEDSAQPYIDTDYFGFYYTDGAAYTGSYWTSTVCKMPVDNDTSDYEYAEKNYGFNWADGHLKSYADGYNIDGTSSGFSISAGVRAVRGEEGVYGVNTFTDNNDNTITDDTTGLMWSKYDDGYIDDDGSILNSTDDGWGEGKTWTDTLAWVETMNNANYGGHSDWRLPNIKELQSIVEYEKTELPALDDDYFELSRPDCFVWSSTTCGDFTEMADYIAIGRGYGINLDDDTSSSSATVDDFVDTHGPGCMRADYKDTESTTTSLTTNYTVSQAPLLSRQKWLDIYEFDTDDMSNYPYDYDTTGDTDDEYSEFDLSNSENAADYVVIYNYALLVRDAN